MNNKKTNIKKCIAVFASLGVSDTVLAQQEGFANFAVDLVSTVVYSMVGIVMGVIGFKVVDWLTPGDLAEEVANKENRALAVLAGSMMLGVCIIIASVLIS